jgi:hypothetical protein
VLGHRFAANDPCGYLMQNDPDKWEVIRLPAIAEPGDVLGRAPGEALWPERWSLESMTEAKKGIAWQAMHQQDPQPEFGDRVYDHFQQAVNVVPNAARPDRDTIRRGPEEIIGLSFDFNINPGMHACVLQADHRADEVYFDTEFHGERWRTHQIVTAFIGWCESYGHVTGNPAKFPWKYVNIYGDRSGRNQSTVTSDTDYAVIAQMLERAGIPFKMCVPFRNPPVNDRVICVNEALCDMGGTPHLFIHKRCVRLLADMNTQPRDENGQPDKTDQSLGHAGDLCGYSLMWIRPVRKATFGANHVVY